MNDESKHVQARLRSAKADLDAANKSVRQVSATRLKAILARNSVAAWVTGLSDKALTPFDKAQLEAMIAGENHKRMRRSIAYWLDRSVSALHRRVRRPSPKLAAVLLLIGVASAVVVTIERQTPEDAAPVRLLKAHKVEWTLPDGTVRTVPEPDGARLVLFRRAGDLYLRRWFAGAGYGDVRVTLAFVQSQLSKR